MKQPIAMPALSDTMNNGRLVKWLKTVGNSVKHGDVLAEIETDKAVMEVEAFHDGFLGGPLAAADTEYKVGSTIGYIADNRAEASSGAAPQPAATIAVPPTVAAASVAPAAPVAPAPDRTALPAATTAHRASPYARRLAHELGVDLATVGTTSGALRAADVIEAARATALPDLAAGPPYRIERNTTFREAVAQTMIASLAVPAFRVTACLYVGPLLATARAEHFSVNVLFARGAAMAIKEHPLFNAVYTPEGLARRDRIDIGIAVDFPEGLITPVLRDVGERSLAALTEDWRRLLQNAKARRLAPADYRGATFYISDLGVFPVVHSFNSLIPAGAAALLSIAAAQNENAFCTLNCDHRVVFGGDAARFLTTLAKVVEDVPQLTA